MLTVKPSLEEGRHRVRAHNLPGGQFVFATRDGGAREATLGAGGGAWPTEELHVSTLQSQVSAERDEQNGNAGAGNDECARSKPTPHQAALTAG